MHAGDLTGPSSSPDAGDIRERIRGNGMGEVELHHPRGLRPDIPDVLDVDQPPVVDHPDPVADSLHLGKHVGGEEDGSPSGRRLQDPTGTVVIRWDGARAPTVWTVPAPVVDPPDARLELARRYLHVFGPTTPEAFAEWAGIGARHGSAAFEALGRSLTPARTPIGDAWILARDEGTFRAAPGPAAPARLLPSGDAYFLLQGVDRELLVPDADRRRALWTPRVWPGALLVEGQLVGTWRRSQGTVTIQTWRHLSRSARDAVEMEAESLPLPGTPGPIVVRWD